jgi:SAM-dependent methyltransferase
MVPYRMPALLSQNKTSEIAFFDSHGVADAYDVFSPDTNERLIDIFVRLSGLAPGGRVVDLGCGSGVFTHVLQKRGYRCAGIDLSPKLIEIARTNYSGIDFQVGDIEHLPFEDGRFDGVLLSGVLHHLPDRSRCAAEVLRILRPGGAFVAFDPNRMNPFMYLYRDRSSPFYSSIGVTENERPVLANDIAATFRRAGFRTGSEFVSGLKYCYIASGKVRWLLPIYNAIDSVLFAPPFMRWFRAFVFSYGVKP